MHAHYSYPLLPELWEAQIIPNFSFVRNFDEYKALKQTCKFFKTIVEKTFPKELTEYSKRILQGYGKEEKTTCDQERLIHLFGSKTGNYYYIDINRQNTFVYNFLALSSQTPEQRNLIRDELIVFKANLLRDLSELAPQSDKNYFFYNQIHLLASVIINGQAEIEHTFQDQGYQYSYVKGISETIKVSRGSDFEELKPRLGTLKAVTPLYGLYLAVVAQGQIHLIKKSNGMHVKTFNNTIDVDAVGCTDDGKKLLYRDGCLNKTFHSIDFSDHQIFFNAGAIKGFVKRRIRGLTQGMLSPTHDFLWRSFKISGTTHVVLKYFNFIKIDDLISKILLLTCCVNLIAFFVLPIFRMMKPRD